MDCMGNTSIEQISWICPFWGSQTSNKLYVFFLRDFHWNSALFLGNSPTSRHVDAPTEARFKQQDEQVTKLQDAMKELREQVVQREKDAAIFEKKVESEFKTVRSEVANQFQQMSQTFQSSLKEHFRNKIIRLKVRLQSSSKSCDRASSRIQRRRQRHNILLERLMQMKWILKMTFDYLRANIQIDSVERLLQ